jgi:hypothetical protein
MNSVVADFQQYSQKKQLSKKIHKSRALNLSLYYCFFFIDYSEALSGLSTSYAALLRIKKSSTSPFGSKSRPRFSSPSLGTISVSPPSWRGAAQQYHSPGNLYHSSDAFRQDGKCRKTYKIAPVREGTLHTRLLMRSLKHAAARKLKFTVL